MTRFRLAALSLALALFFGAMPNGSAMAGTCTVTTKTQDYVFYTVPNVDHQTRWFRVRIVATGCYHYASGYVAGQSMSSTFRSKSALGGGATLTGQGYFRSGNVMDFWANWYQRDVFYDTYAYPRLKLSTSGVWSLTGTNVQCNFGLIGGTCYWDDPWT